jgi:hypothetical protein
MARLGIDIGLKNLSLCVIDCDFIKLWGVYNILDEELLCCKCIRKAKYTCTGETYCGLHSRKIEGKKEIKTKKIKSYSLQDLTSKIIKSFEGIIDDNEEVMNSVSSVKLELQPSLNPKMKFTSHVLFTLLTKFYTDKKCSIKFERASVKLKKYKSEVYLKNTYTNRKRRAIEYTKSLLKNIKNSDEYECLMQSKKLDDLCDSFLLSY